MDLDLTIYRVTDDGEVTKEDVQYSINANAEHEIAGKLANYGTKLRRQDPSVAIVKVNTADGVPTILSWMGHYTDRHIPAMLQLDRDIS